jgi:hypothetical protein
MVESTRMPQSSEGTAKLGHYPRNQFLAYHELTRTNFASRAKAFSFPRNSKPRG